MKHLFSLAIMCFTFHFLVAQGSGNVLTYNGTNQSVSLGTLVAGNCRTVEFWMKTTNTINGSISDAIAVIIRDYNNGDAASINEFGFYFKPSNWNQGNGGCLIFYRRVGGTNHEIHSNSTSWQANTWYHIAGVIDPVTGMKMYVNGVLQTNTESSTQPIQVQTGNPTDEVVIAKWGHPGPRYLAGDIDEVRFWTAARSQSEIRDNMCRKINPVQAGLNAYYRFDNSSTTTLTDLTGNGYNGTLTNLPANSWHYSSAPIGDTATNVYPASWTAQTLNLQYAAGDQFTISNVTGTPAGAHIYRVNSLPNSTTGLNSPLASYYGVFLTGITGNFDINYAYSAYSQFCSGSCTELGSRNDNAVLSWSSIAPVFNGCSLTKTNESSVGQSFRAEYILALNSNIPPNILGNDTSLCASSYLLNATFSGATYLWNTNATSATISVTSSGTYWVDVTVNGCTRRDSITLILNQLSSSVSTQSNVSCNGGNNGSATVFATGGSGNYSYSWSPSGGTTASASGLPAGSYTCTITDPAGCITTQQVNITQPSALSTTISSTNILCNNANNGTASVTANGGTPGYSYSWTPTGGTNATAANLGPGSYTCTITDANGCTSVQHVTITQPSALTSSASATNILCNGANNGTASVNVNGGTPGYTYSWTPAGGTNANATNLSAGNYTCTITDANGCISVQQVTITQPSALTSSSSATNILCNGANNGTASVSVNGGTPGYTYSWTPAGGSNANATNLPAGNYTCTITDANGCISVQQVNITQPSALACSLSSTNILCNGANNGTASVNVSGGTPGYTYSWSPAGGTNANATNLSAGNYTCTITDANGCTSIQQVAITQPNVLTASANVTNGLCSNGGLGSANVSASGGTGSYTYSWSPSGGTQNNIGGLATGNYTCTITDANGCSTSVNANITSTVVVPVASFTTNAVNGVIVLNADTGQICFTDMSTGTSSWLWNFNNTSASPLQSPPCITLTGNNTGNYCATLYVTSSSGCVDSSDVCIEVVKETTFFIPNVFTPNGDGTNDLFMITGDGIAALQCSIYDRWGELIYQWDSPSGYWNGKAKNGKFVTDGTYYYVATITGFNGEKHVAKGFMTLLLGSR